MNIMLASWHFYEGCNRHYLTLFPGLGTSDEYFATYCMGGEL
jgi:hypothetical protein